MSRSGSMRRLGRAAAAVLASLVVVAAGVGPVAAYSILFTGDQTGDGYADTWLLDDNLDGAADRLVIDSNEDGALDASYVYATGTAWINGNGNQVFEMAIQNAYNASGALVGRYMYADANENGLYESIYWDGQLDGIYESVMVDTNYDGVADTWRGSVAPAGRGATDLGQMGEAVNSANRILWGAGICVFYCG